MLTIESAPFEGTRVAITPRPGAALTGEIEFSLHADGTAYVWVTDHSGALSGQPVGREDLRALHRALSAYFDRP